MPSLILLKSPGGASPGETIPLDGELLVIGRDADTCQIVIPHHAVSRRHAQITRTKEQYYIEDLKSRNKTFVNNKEVSARSPLKPDDRIKICDFLFRFHDERVGARPLPIPPNPPLEEEEEDDPGGMTTIEATKTSVSAKAFLDVAQADRLRALLDISTGLSRTLELSPLLEQIAKTLFDVFKQADRCFIILLDENGKQVPKVTRNRRPGADDTRFSKTIVKKTIDKLESYLSEDASSDASLGPAASIAEFKIRSAMCAPLATAEGRPLGAIQLDTQDRAKKFREDDLHMLMIVANLASVSIDKAKLHDTLLAREKERKEIELARAVQLGFLPQTFPEIVGYEFYSHYSPAQTVGGDYYDYIHLPGNRLAVVLGDVAGKGVPAALLVAKLSSEVRFCLLTEPDPARAMNLLNDQMIRGGLADRFVTLAAVVLDPVAHRLTVVNAGHMNPVIYRGARGELGDVISNDQTGLPLGVMPGFEYEEVTLELAHGDTIVMFTDGVSDAISPAGELFGIAGVRKYLTVDERAGDASRPKRLGDRLVQAVRRHADGKAQNDDIAVVCFGRLEPPGQGTGVTRGPATPTTPLRLG
ncbi:MAG TPA: SpoIIE family protein phosphatase [Gemmataceae bacterium]|nr:SpoIIE family protein phosphatase [Gemmataceae bacterium]